jgi:hypothetical protein
LRKTLCLALLAVLALLAAGCGSDDESDGSATATTETEQAAADPQQVARRIEQLLDRIARTYDPAAPDAAGELAAEAYLENYEVIEDGVKEADPELNERIEPLLGAQLRKRISEGAPKGEIESMVKQAKQLVAQAATAVEQQ